MNGSEGRRERALGAGGLVALTALIVIGLGTDGLWNPWELDAAELVRTASPGGATATHGPWLPLWLTHAAFALGGPHAWVGRLPSALAGVATVALAFAMTRRFADTRAGLYAALVTGSTPLLLFNARFVGGDTLDFAAQALLAWCALEAALPRPRGAEARPARIASAGWLAGLVVGAVVSTMATGVLAGPLPPLLAAAVVGVVFGGLRAPSPGRAVRWALLLACAGLTLGTVLAVLRDPASYSVWLGGAARGGEPPAFDVTLEHVFHGFAPWSPLAPVALAAMFAPRNAASEHVGASDDRDDVDAALSPRRRRDAARFLLPIWAAFGYASLSLYKARYGEATFMPAVALGASIALYLRDVELRGTRDRTAAVVALLFVGLLVRDFDLYPAGPAQVLSLDGLVTPVGFHPRVAWSALLSLFALVLVVGLTAASTRRRVRFDAPYRFLGRQWRRGGGLRVWVALAGGLVAACLLAGTVCWAAGDALPLNTLVVRIGRALLFVAVGLPLVAAAAQLVWSAGARLGGARMAPALAVGLVVGAYAAHGYLPELGSHFSPRPLLRTFERLAAPGADLLVYRKGERSAQYYLHGRFEVASSARSLVDALASGGQRWALVPSDDLASIDRKFRQRTGRHLFAPAEPLNALSLVASEPVRDAHDYNPLAATVLAAPPAMQHRVDARLDDRVALLGYDLDLPERGFVGVGQQFTITWYWRAVGPPPAGFKVFVHIDGQGQRLNGDHDPVEGRYPFADWDEGDVVVDRQTLRVPATFRPGEYTLYVGLFRGDERMKVTAGPKDESDRIRAGVIRVQ
ncbi:MAG: glycosyltransferase family 39 protein [Myxococcales bacterium]|nr:glycosyltransferase family 39 protein [Myxococcales bacterium]